jgi:hypothetical protein
MPESKSGALPLGYAQSADARFAGKMHERWPDLRVLCVSGYTDGVLPEVIDGRADGLHFLAKPFRRRDLALGVRAAIDAKEEVAATVS